MKHAGVFSCFEWPTSLKQTKNTFHLNLAGRVAKL